MGDTKAGHTQSLDAEVVNQLDRKRRLRDITSMYFLHLLHEPPTDVRVRRGKALLGLNLQGAGPRDVRRDQTRSTARIAALGRNAIARRAGLQPPGAEPVGYSRIAFGMATATPSSPCGYTRT